MKKPIIVVSYGGCGSKFVVRQIARYLEGKNYNNNHSHLRTPDSKFLGQYEKVIFVFGVPILAVKSFFGRRLANTKLHSYYNQKGIPDKNWAKNITEILKINFKN